MFVAKARVNFPLRLLQRRSIRWWALGILVLSCSSALAQAFVPGTLIEGRYPAFNKSVVREKGIASVTIRLMRKPSSKTIYDDGRRVIYHFDAQGELTSFQKVNPGPYGGADTISTTWIRMNGVVQAKAERVGQYRRRITYSYPNDSTALESIKVKRGEMDWQDIGTEQVVTKRRLIQGNEIIISFRGGVDAKPYQRTITTIGPQGIEGKESWIGARVQFTEEWHYRQKQVSEFTHRNVEQGTELTITYSTETELQDEGTWCENGACRNWSLVYNDEGLPKGWIIIDPETQDLEIWEYRYSFH